MTQQGRTPIRIDDLTWLNMDRPNNLMVVSGLMWLRDQPDADAIDDAGPATVLFARFHHSLADGIRLAQLLG